MTQRQIKFRAWDRKNLGFVYFELYPNGATSVQSNFPELLNSDITPWEQFTGLLDKNGKEIYEGDVIRCFDKSGEKVIDDAVELPEFYRLIWSHRADELPAELNERTAVEVIGNIHENSDLLSAPVEAAPTEQE